jgi:hypothetical protein
MVVAILLARLAEWWHFLLQTGQNCPPHRSHQQGWYFKNDTAALLHSPVPLQNGQTALLMMNTCFMQHTGHAVNEEALFLLFPIAEPLRFEGIFCLHCVSLM